MPYSLNPKMKCLKINFRATDRWIVCGESAIEIINEVKKKIGVEEDTPIIIKDKDFTEIDEDVLEFFCKSREEPYLRIFLASDSITESFAPPLGRLSDFNIENGIKDAEIIFEDIGRSLTPSLSTTSSLSTLSTHSVIQEEASPESDDIQKYIVRGGGQYIIDQYNKNKMLTDRCRIQLVNIVANVLFEKFGTAVPKSVKMEYAKKLVEAFPIYRNSESSCGGYEIFFNPLTNGGYLANRLRTLNRIHKVEGTSSKSVDQTKANHSPVRNETTIIPDDMDEKLKDLMTTPSTEKEKIKRLFLETYSFRKNLTNKTSIMEMFPRLRDTCGLVEQEFSLMFPSCSSNFEERYLAVMDKIVSIYTRTTSSSHPLSDCGFSLKIQSFYALLKMLPPSPKGKRKKDLIPTSKSFEKIIVFQQVSLPLQETIEKNSNTQPYIIARGPCKLSLKEYLIILDGEPLPELFNTFEKSFDYLVKVHFVFQVQYDQSLGNFFKFIQVYFYNIETENVLFNSAMLKLKCLLNDNIQTQENAV